MGVFKIGEPIKNIQEYDEYPYSHLYWHGNLVGKAVTDNWQYRMISNGIKNNYLYRAVLNEEYSLFKMSYRVFANFASMFDHSGEYICPAKNAQDAEKKLIKNKFYGSIVSTGIEHEYAFPDESGIIKVRTVKISDRENAD